MTLTEQQFKFSSLLAQLVLFINGLEDYRCAVGEVERPPYLQNHYFKTGKSKTKNSRHLYRLAADLKVFKRIGDQWVYLDKTPDYEFAGKYWESLDPHCVWGGRFGDRPDTAAIEGWDGGHFQYGR